MKKELHLFGELLLSERILRNHTLSIYEVKITFSTGIDSPKHRTDKTLWATFGTTQFTGFIF